MTKKFVKCMEVVPEQVLSKSEEKKLFQNNFPKIYMKNKIVKCKEVVP